MLNVNTTEITIVDETRECLSRQMMLTYPIQFGNVIIQAALTGHCVIVPWRTQAPPGPSKFF